MHEGSDDSNGHGDHSYRDQPPVQPRHRGWRSEQPDEIGFGSSFFLNKFVGGGLW